MTALSMMINNRSISFTAGQTILEVAQSNQIRIPTLCHLKGATPTGACRICVVEVHGARTLLAAAGMIVQTDSPKVIEARKTVLELMLSSGHHNCASANAADNNDWTGFQMKVQEADESGDLCPAWGDCKLQNLAYEYQVTASRFGYDFIYSEERLKTPLIRANGTFRQASWDTGIRRLPTPMPGPNSKKPGV